MTIYEELIAAGVEIDHDASDLFALVTPESHTVVRKYEFKNQVQCFHSLRDGRLWYDIPFAYDPFWKDVEERTRQDA